MGLLSNIIANKQLEIARLGPCGPRRDGLRPVAATLQRPASAPLRIIAELKPKSPSAGALSLALTLTQRARIYADAGAVLLSVLTDSAYFGGKLGDIAEVRQCVDVALLCKDFILDPRQLEHAYAAGADAALLIVRCLSDLQLRELLSTCGALGLTALVEVTDEQELKRALRADAQVIGVNARDLDTLVMDPVKADAVVARIPAEKIAVRLSGVKAAEDVAKIAASRADATLIGESLMRLDDPRPALQSYLRAARTPR